MKKAIQTLLHGEFGAQIVALYLRCIYYTSRVQVEFASGLKETESPVIFCGWHGQNIMFAFLARNRFVCTGMAARHGDGHTVGRGVERVGMKMVYGSGSTGMTRSDKGGARAFLALLRRLRANECVALTADMPKTARVVGDGLLTLARKSGAPIAPVGIATSRRKVLKTWDRAQIHKPFSRLVYVVGPYIHVPDDGSDFEEHRARVFAAIESVQARAFDLADRGKTSG